MRFLENIDRFFESVDNFETFLQEKHSLLLFEINILFSIIIKIIPYTVPFVLVFFYLVIEMHCMGILVLYILYGICSSSVLFMSVYFFFLIYQLWIFSRPPKKQFAPLDCFNINIKGISIVFFTVTNDNKKMAVEKAKEVRSKVDLIIARTHLDSYNASKLTKNFNEVDFWF